MKIEYDTQKDVYAATITYTDPHKVVMIARKNRAELIDEAIETSMDDTESDCGPDKWDEEEGAVY